MTVPVAEPIDRPTAPPRPAGDAARARVLEILVAEDNDINQEVIGGLLRGHRLTMVKDGGEAVEAARKARFDLILMDVMMPVMNGLQATAAIRALPPPEAAVPIIALTANSMSGDRERYLAAGMNAYVSKPIERRTLLEVIETVIGEPVWQSAATETAAVPPLAPTTEATSEIDDFITSLEA
jgi:CheY-like chemotaxis protein